MTTTDVRLQEWINYWCSDQGKAPRRPLDVSEYHDDLLRKAARNVAFVERERGED
jgi:hypothetical protein